MPASASASSKVPNGPTADPEIKAELEEIEGILTQKSEAKFGEEEEKVEIEKAKTKESELNPRPTGWKDGSVLFCDFCILLLSYINCKNRMNNFWKLDECQDIIDDIKIKVPEFKCHRNHWVWVRTEIPRFCSLTASSGSGIDSDSIDVFQNCKMMSSTFEVRNSCHICWCNLFGCFQGQSLSQKPKEQMRWWPQGEIHITTKSEDVGRNHARCTDVVGFFIVKKYFDHESWQL